MKRRSAVQCVFILASIFTSSEISAQTAVSVAAHIGDFHIAVANYYHVPEREVVVIRERRISDDDLPVVLFIAREARVPVARVIELREHGRSWWDISVRFGLRPDVYYVPMAMDPGPPYGRAYGYYKKPRKQWDRIVLSDADVVNFVHLRFLSEHYGIPPERVVEARGHSRGVVAMYSDIGGRRSGGERAREQHGERSSVRAQGNEQGNEHGKGNGKGRGHGR